jgi:steroid 5-alpha reductase family enzyme
MIHWIVSPVPEPVTIWGARYIGLLPRRLGCEEYALWQWSAPCPRCLSGGSKRIADRQLAAFRDDPANKGRVCDVGLWGMSRHPNYFFEWMGWFAYTIIAIDFSGGYPWGWLALAGPALMYWLLVHASGIPPLEAHMLRSRGQAFRDYQHRVNAFWPGPQHAADAHDNGDIR